MDDTREIDAARDTFEEGANSGTSCRVEIEAIELDMMWVKKERAYKKKKESPIESLDRATLNLS